LSEISDEERARIYMHGVATERARVVAYLMARSKLELEAQDNGKREWGDMSDMALENVAEEIERGEHLKPQDVAA